MRGRARRAAKSFPAGRIYRGLVPRATLDVWLAELEFEGEARVTLIEPCPPIADGHGSVVTGRFVTHQVSNLVELTLDSGTTLTGTTTHPVWSITASDWIPLSALLPGELVDTHSGPQAVVDVQDLTCTSDVYNIEVHGHHVYRVTSDGVLVHNASLSGLGGAPIGNAVKHFYSRICSDFGPRGHSIA